MAQQRILRRLVRYGAEGNQEEFRAAAEDLVRAERRKRHHLLANDLEMLLERGSVRAAPSRAYEPPVDRETGLPLLDVRAPRKELGDIVLAEDNRRVVEEVLQQHGRAEELATYGLRPSSRILLCGPPGCGKTTAAEVLASEVGLDLAIVRFDSVVSSLLGETATNLRAVFDFLERERVVALFDEFDALGKTRSDDSEHGELKRVVSALLQMMDAYRGRSLLVAATNHETLLDAAIWRRFDEVLMLERPTKADLGALLQMKLRSVRHEIALDDEALLASLKGYTHADVERLIVRAIKSMVMSDEDVLSMETFTAARSREDARLSLSDTST